MCTASAPTTGGYLEIEPGMDLNLDLAPDCCEQEMTRRDENIAGCLARIYRCACCRIEVHVDDAGLVDDIRG